MGGFFRRNTHPHRFSAYAIITATGTPSPRPWARNAIPPLLLDTPLGMLDEFGLLAQLLQELADRLSFLCSWALEFFLEPETPRHSDADHLQVALDVLLQKLAEEVERLREICAQGPCLSLHEVLCDYRDQLLRRVVVGEHEDLE